VRSRDDARATEVIMQRRLVAAIAVGAAAFVVVGCAGQPITKREKGALAGGALGAGTGAIIGSATGDAGEGALIGGALGALGGAVVGDQLEGRDRRARAQSAELESLRAETARNRQLLEELRRRDLDVRETERGVVVNLPDVLFEFDRADLTPEARRRTRDIADVLARAGRGRRVAIEGHTDSIGSESYNQRLSQARAERVADALAEERVSPGRMRVRGYGERQPIAPNSVSGRDNPEGRARNRRVEVVIEN
jgi:outer membrane protein OmpA-like peptidoglycan-associated protein